MRNIKNRVLLMLMVILLFFSPIYAQRENDTWVFGNSKWIFDSNQPNGFLHSSIGNYPFVYGTASISNENTGQLLFYSDGIGILDKNGNLMQNGGNLYGPASPGSSLERFYFTANWCGGNRTQQPVLILPKPGSANKYYVFYSVYTTYRHHCTDGFPDEFYNFGLRYAEVDMSNGLGTVISKNNLIQTNGSEGLTSTLHSNGNSFWLVSTNNGNFYSYRVDSQGVSSTPVISSFTENVYGTIKISPNGQYLFNNALYATNNYSIYNFNNGNGQVTNRVPILPSNSGLDIYVDSSKGPSSFEFSPDSNILYFISVGLHSGVDAPYFPGSLSMYNISTGQLAGNTQLFEFDRTAANLQLAKDGKIYLIFNDQYYINNEQDIGTEFGYYLNGNTYSFDWGVIKNPNLWSTNINPISYITPPLNVKNGFMFPQLIPELPQCVNNLNITENVQSGNIDMRSASNTITATNIIFSGGTAEYDAGVRVFLKPGFNAKSGSNFRGFIQGCTIPAPFSKTEEGWSKSNENEGLQSERVLILHPNPTLSLLKLLSEEDMSKWEISNTFGVLQYSGVFNNNNSRSIEVNLDNLITGVYYVKVVFRDGEVVTKILIKE